MDKKYIDLPVFCRRMEVPQTWTVYCATTPYIIGETNDFKAMLLCVGVQTMPLRRQRFRTVRTIVGYTIINPSSFLFHYISSIQKSCIFQTIST